MSQSSQPTQAGPQNQSSGTANPQPNVKPHLNIKTHGPESGANVILIHGWPLSGASWEHQIDALTQAGLRVTTYDRRGFGDADKPAEGYDYDTLSDDLAQVIDSIGAKQVSLVGFSMGGGEVARFVGRHGESRIKSLVFAAAVTPCLLKSPTNPDGPLTDEKAQQKSANFAADREGYLANFADSFFSVDGTLAVSASERDKALKLAAKADSNAALACMKSYSSDDFRPDIAKITRPTLVIHGDADAIVPFEGSGLRTHALIPHSQLVVIKRAPHGLNVSHKDEFNRALVAFLTS